jgi:hypothetical protein
MKKLTKYFTTMFAIAAMLALNTYADIVIYNPTSTAAVSLLQKGARINQILFSNAATNAITLTFTDAPTNTLTYVVGAYTNSVVSTPSTVTTFTNIYGVVQSSTNTTFTLTPTAVAASTNNYRTVLIQLIPASSTITFTPPIGLNVGFGLAAATTATNVTATVSYSPTR